MTLVSKLVDDSPCNFNDFQVGCPSTFFHMYVPFNDSCCFNKSFFRLTLMYRQLERASEKKTLVNLNPEGWGCIMGDATPLASEKLLSRYEYVMNRALLWYRFKFESSALA